MWYNYYVSIPLLIKGLLLNMAFKWEFKMVLEKINLKNFRNYDRLNLILNKGVNIFYGNNAEGKTNILESVYLLALTKSHRNIKSDEIIKFGKDFLKVEGNILVDNNKRKQEIIISKNNKKVKIDGLEEKKLSKYISNLFLNILE